MNILKGDVLNMKKFDIKKLELLDRDKCYIFSVEVGNRSTDAIVDELSAIHKYLTETLKFKKCLLYPTINGVADVVFDNFDKYIVEE